MPAFKRAKKNPSQTESGRPVEAQVESASTPASGAVKGTPDAANDGHAELKPASIEPGNAQRDKEDGSKSPTNDPQTALNARQSWYGGTWPRTPAKAAPVTQIAKESISGGSELVARATENAKAKAGSLRSIKKAPSLYMSPGVSTRSLPSTGTASKVSVSTPKLGLTESHDGTDDVSLDSEDTKVPGKSGPDSKQAASVLEEEDSKISDPSTAKGEAGAGLEDGAAWGMSSWIPGFRRADPQTAKPLPSDLSKTTDVEQPGNGKALSSESANAPTQASQATEAQEAETDAHNAASAARDAAEEKPSSVKSSSRPRSWFGLWTGDPGVKDTKSSVTSGTLMADSPKPTIDADLAIRAAAPTKTQELDAGENEQTPEERAAATSAAINDATQSDPATSARWGWWGRTAPEESSGADTITSPRPAADQHTPEDVEMTDAGSSSTPSRKRDRPASAEIPHNGREDKISKQSVDGKTSATAAVNVVKDDGSRKGKEKPIEHTHDPTNLLLPTIKQTYKAAESPGLIERLAQYLFTSKAEAPKHVHLAKDPPKVKHAIAIGVHGYFPAPFIRTMIGQPKGTSVKFAHMASEAIRDWCKQHGCDPKIDRIVLEGEGKIDERIDLLWKLLIRHIELIREADFVLVACHSQGVPVAVQLVAKLIKFGVLAGKRIGVCAMAGVNLGPFPEYKSRWIGGSAGELFDFASPDSQVSTDYQNALATVLKSGVKLVLIGSIDDQLVSMESATFGNVDHPGIYRAVFVNGQVHAPTFVVHLVGFALKLRNLGIPDHGLVRELSNSLAGSFTGDGHSRLYEDSTLYDMAIEFALETTACTDVAVKIRSNTSTSSVNPYILPFAMRGVLEEDFVKSDLHSEMNQLLSQFDDWKPATKQLRDVKFRLEGVRSKM